MMILATHSQSLKLVYFLTVIRSDCTVLLSRISVITRKLTGD